MVKYELMKTIDSSIFSGQRACQILGLNPERFYRWRENFQRERMTGLIDHPPVARLIPGRLLSGEVDAILRYAEDYPNQHHREIAYNLERKNLAVVSPSSVYRELSRCNLIAPYIWKRPHKKWEKPEATAPHQHWFLDLTYIPVGDIFWYLIVLIDLYSRYIVGWELSPSAWARDIKRVIDFTLAAWKFTGKENKPHIHSDRGPQMKAKSLLKFLRDIGVAKEFSRPRVPEDLACLERFFRTVKQEEVYHQEYPDHLEARDSLSRFIDYYNHRRPHQGIGNVTPDDKLTDRDTQIIQERKNKSLLAQRYRKLQNCFRQNRCQTKETGSRVDTFKNNFFLERV